MTYSFNEAVDNLEKLGYLDMEIDPALDLFHEIEILKKNKNAVILAHYYQEPDIQDIADFTGDSLGLALQASKTEADIIVFAGVHFMAEAAKILCPEKKVVLPDLKAGCSLSDSCSPGTFKAFKEKHPDHLVISYVNCSAEIKALSDIICTSSNARAIINSLPADQRIIFAPDRNLGAYLNKKCGREMLLWNGSCVVHELFSQEKIVKLRSRHPQAKLIAHPECEEAILELADFIGSTGEMLRFVEKDEAGSFIVATEAGILHRMKLASPTKILIPAPPENACGCNNCPYMKLNTLEKIYLCLKYELPEIVIGDELRIKARKPLDRMMELSKRFGLT